MKIVYFFDESRQPKEKAVVETIYGKDVQYISERPWFVADTLEKGDFLICSSIEDLSAEEVTLNQTDSIVKEYMNILNRGVELVFDLSTQCNSLFIKTLTNNEREFEAVLKKCIMNYASQKEIAAKYAKKNIIIARANGSRVGLQKGTKLVTKKSVYMKAKIKELSKDFDGNMSDEELMNYLGIARNSYYKYKKSLREEDQ